MRQFAERYSLDSESARALQRLASNSVLRAAGAPFMFSLLTYLPKLTQMPDARSEDLFFAIEDLVVGKIDARSATRKHVSLILQRMAVQRFETPSQGGFNGGFDLRDIEHAIADQIGPGTDLHAEVLREVQNSPLVRSDGQNRYIFIHETIGEWMAAHSIAEATNPLDWVRRSVLSSHLAHSKILALVVGLCPANQAYTLLESLPESVDFAVLMLRSRALSYVRTLDVEHVRAIADTFHDLIVRVDFLFDYRLRKLADNLAGAMPALAGTIVIRLVPLLRHADPRVRTRAADVLGASRFPQAVAPLAEILNDDI